MNHLRLGGICASLLLLVWLSSAPGAAGGPKGPLPDPALDDAVGAAKGKSSIVLAGGCFWGMEEVFQHVRGVVDVTSGYAGGSARNAKYELVSTGTTGHAESVKVAYDPSKVSHRPIVEGVLLGRPRSDPAERAVARHRPAIPLGDFLRQRTAAGARQGLYRPAPGHASLSKFDRDGAGSIDRLLRGEDYHQDYATKHPQDRYIVQIDMPKVENLRQQLPALYVK